MVEFQDIGSGISIQKNGHRGHLNFTLKAGEK
jgi:hypothetical protein